MLSSCISVYGLTCSFVIFFFKQKTAYDIRISDWSSDVCSSDLRIITANSRKTEAFPDDALTRESSIAVDKDREHFLVLRQIVANHLLRPHLAEHDRIDGFKMRGVGNQGHMDVDAVE